MGIDPTLSHSSATYNYLRSPCQQKFHIFQGFLYFGDRASNILRSQSIRPQNIAPRITYVDCLGGEDPAGCGGIRMRSYPTQMVSPGRVIGTRPMKTQGVNGSGLKWIVKPDSVMTHSGVTAIIHLAPRLLTGSSDLTRGLRADHPTLLFGLAPGGVCQASTITGEPVSSYLAISTLPACGWRYVFCGTFPRSLGAAISGHPVLRSPDFPLSTRGGE